MITNSVYLKISFKKALDENPVLFYFKASGRNLVTLPIKKRIKGYDTRKSKKHYQTSC